MGSNLTQAGDLRSISLRRQHEREIAERVFAEAIRKIIAVHPDLEKEDLFPRLCGHLNLDDETWDRYQALARRKMHCGAGEDDHLRPREVRRGQGCACAEVGTMSGGLEGKRSDSAPPLKTFQEVFGSRSAGDPAAPSQQADEVRP